MKIVSFTDGQSGKEWLDWRKNGIGASDVPVLMGSNKWKTILDLWNDKCGFSSECYINRAMQHGIDNEERRKFEYIREDVLSISCGRWHTMIVTKEGDLFGCGENINGQLGLGDAER